MAARAARVAVALAALVAVAPARAQWRTTPMVVWLDGSRTVLAGGFATSGGADLLVLDPASTRSELRPHHDLLRVTASAFAFPPISSPAFRAGYLAQAGSDGLADVARIPLNGSVEVAFGTAPGTRRSYPVAAVQAGDVASFVHLLPRAADVVVVPASPGDRLQARVAALDFDPVLAPTLAHVRAWSILPLYLNTPSSQGFEVAGLRLSAVARQQGLDDLAVMGNGGLVLLVHDEVPLSATLDALVLSTIEVGGNHGGQYTPPFTAANRPPWLPPTIALPGDVLGVAVMDVDRDGQLDLVFPQSIVLPDGTPYQAAVVWARGTGTPQDFAEPAATPWTDLGAELGLVKPLLVRQVSVAGNEGFATWDAATEEVVVVWNEGIVRRVWRAPAPGRLATDIRQVDLVGSGAADLVVVVENGVGPGAALVYPDLGQPGPLLRWAPGSPGRWLRGAPLAVAVEVDPAGAATVGVDWISGAATSTPVGTGFSHVFPAVCTAPPARLGFTARGIDPTGVFTELSASLPLEVLAPALALGGGQTLRLPPGGTTAVFEASLATSCGEARFGGTAWPAGATVTDAAGAAWVRRTVVLGEVTYPALLAAPAQLVSVASADPLVVPSTVTIAVPLDASGLVEVHQEADRTSLAPGEVVVVRTRLRSRIGVPIPLVRVVAALAGLEVAGAPVVSGAALVSSERGGAEIVVSALPAAGGEVWIELPVRALSARSSAAAEARSSGGWALTAPARTKALAAGRAPGCGCGTGSAPGTLTLALLALALRRRARRAT
jgi:uncharacterized protein (TIGR03382 family)